MTCHLPDPSAYHPSPSPASHRSHFPFTASAACSAPCTLPHFYTSSLPGPHSNVPLPGAFLMTPPKTPLAQHSRSPFLHYRHPACSPYYMGTAGRDCCPQTRIQELREHRFWLLF